MKVEKTFFLFEGKRVGGFSYIPEGVGKFPAVILVHGFGGGIHELKNRFMCEKLAEAGIAAFMFDFYDEPNGLSEILREEMTVSLQLRVLRSAIDCVCGLPIVDVSRIGLTGHSLGGMTVLLYTPTDSRVKVLVVQSGVSDFEELVAHWGDVGDWKKRGYKHFDKSWGGMDVKYALVEDGMRYDVYAQARKITCPVLVFHGDQDTSVPLQESEELMSSLKKEDELAVLHGCGHTYKEEGIMGRATMLLVGFMKKWL